MPLRFRFCPASFLALAVALGSVAAQAAEIDVKASEQRLLESVKYLASDELEGRGLGTGGIDLAAKYLAEQFKAMGLKTEVVEGTPFQPFKLTLKAELGKTNTVTLVGPPPEAGKPEHKQTLKLATEFTPLALGGSGKLDLPLAFVGYGITAKEFEYDDYAGIDVKGKAVIVLRKEPHQEKADGKFDGPKTTPHAFYGRKLSNAYEHGAEAVIFVTDAVEIRKSVADRKKEWLASLEKLHAATDKLKPLVENAEATREDADKVRKEIDRLADDVKEKGKRLDAAYDPLVGFSEAQAEAGARKIPVLHMQRAVVDKLLAAAGQANLAQLEREIDADLKPRSAVLANWKLTGEITVDWQESEVKNVLAVLEGEGPLADETVIVGAHYDHLGYGGAGSFVPGQKVIHNGADDNASGTATLLEIARRLAGREKKPPRRVVFICFTAEERGLIGSARYVKNPVFPLDKTVAMLNLDMVGRLQDEKLVVYGTGTAKEFSELVKKHNESYKFLIKEEPSGFGPSDHQSFYVAKVPVLHFFTGTHGDYHRPSDDFDKLNVPGMQRVASLVVDLTLAVAENPARPQYQETKGGAPIARSGNRPYFGSIPDFSSEGEGFAVSGVAKGSPAEMGGLMKGDVIVRLGESRIGNLDDFDSALRKFKGGDKVAVVVKRGGKEVELQVVLGEPR